MVFGDYLEQAAKSGLRLHDVPNAACYWVILSGQTTPDREDYCPDVSVGGRPERPEEPGERRARSGWR